MISKRLFIFGLFLVVGSVIAEASHAEAMQEYHLDLVALGGGRIQGNSQIQEATPTPQDINSTEQIRPLASEAGRDIGLIISSAVLVLIVIAGVVWGLKRQNPAKEGD